jgi:ABC-type nitrate/sulfonate/bicarbonate transport system substrate-binding protein
MVRRWLSMAVVVVAIAALSACSSGLKVNVVAFPSDLDVLSGTDVPRVTVDAGWSPIGDGLVPVIGERRGYFSDVGISFSRSNGYKSNLLSSMTPLLNGQIQIGDTYMPLLAPQMSTVRSVTTFALPTTAHVQRILAPKGRYTTLDQLTAKGVPFKEAAAQVMAQMKGKRFLMYTGIDPQFYNIALGLAGLSLDDVQTSYMGDPDMVTAAQSGRGDFASPNGAVQVSQLQSAGWEPIITISDVIDNMPAETLNMANIYTGFLTTKAFASDDYATLLRFTGVMFRINQAIAADPVGACGVYVDYVNSYTGSNMTAQDCSKLYTDGIYVLNQFDDYQTVADNFAKQTDAQIQRLQQQGVLPAGDYSAADISIIGRVYHDLRTYRDKARELLATAPPGTDRDKAQSFYDQFDYLDAYRYAMAAAR